MAKNIYGGPDLYAETTTLQRHRVNFALVILAPLTICILTLKINGNRQKLPQTLLYSYFRKPYVRLQLRCGNSWEALIFMLLNLLLKHFIAPGQLYLVQQEQWQKLKQSFHQQVKSNCQKALSKFFLKSVFTATTNSYMQEEVLIYLI